MSDISIKETCSCGATFACTGTTYRSFAGGGTNTHHRGAEEMAERWRSEHKHHEPATPTAIVRRVIAKGRPRMRASRIATRTQQEGAE